MNKVNLHVLSDYKRFVSIAFDVKVVNVEEVTFNTTKPSRSDYLYHNSQLAHFSRHESIELIAEQKSTNLCSYKFQIRCKDFCASPLFRFDSDGSAHRNSWMPLSQQQIPTPHYNSFDKHGRSYAFNNGLENVSYDELKDMQKFWKLFCQQCHIETPVGTIPLIRSGDPTLLEFDLHNTDLLLDVNFPL